MVSVKLFEQKIEYAPRESEIFPGWYVIPGYKNNYASKDGRILLDLREKNKGVRKTKGSEINGYRSVYRTTDDGKRYSVRVHRLVCLAFYGPPPSNRYEINHKDGNKKNNAYTNLEWVLHRDNVEHAIDTGLRNDWERVYASAYGLDTLEVHEHYSFYELEKILNIPAKEIRNVVNHTHFGLLQNEYLIVKYHGENIELGELLDIGEKMRSRTTHNVYEAWDFIDDLMYVDVGLSGLGSQLGVSVNAAYTQLKEKGYAIVHNRYIIFPETFPMELLPSKEEARAKCYIVRNHETMETTLVAKLSDAARKINKTPKHLVTQLARGNKRFGKYGVKRYNDTGGWGT